MPDPIDPRALRVDDDGVTLLGGWSPSSGYRHFPRQPLCPFTGADDVEPLDLPRAGRVWLWTTVTAPPPGYQGPSPTAWAWSNSTVSRCCESSVASSAT